MKRRGIAAHVQRLHNVAGEIGGLLDAVELGPALGLAALGLGPFVLVRGDVRRPARERSLAEQVVWGPPARVLAAHLHEHRGAGDDRQKLIERPAVAEPADDRIEASHPVPPSGTVGPVAVHGLADLGGSGVPAGGPNLARVMQIASSPEIQLRWGIYTFCASCDFAYLSAIVHGFYRLSPGIESACERWTNVG